MYLFGKLFLDKCIISVVFFLFLSFFSFVRAFAVVAVIRFFGYCCVLNFALKLFNINFDVSPLLLSPSSFFLSLPLYCQYFICHCILRYFFLLLLLLNFCDEFKIAMHPWLVELPFIECVVKLHVLRFVSVCVCVFCYAVESFSFSLPHTHTHTCTLSLPCTLSVFCCFLIFISSI